LRQNKFYITTAIDYVNASPHIGHAYEKICTDALARWHRFRGDDVYFLTGTDENAQKNVQAARQARLEVKDFVRQNSLKFIELCNKLNLSNDDFIRTTEERHKKVTQLIFKKIYDKGDIYKGIYEGLYCRGCEAFLTDKELINGKCPEHNIAPELIKEENYLFKLSKYQHNIIELLEKGFVEPETRSNEIINRVKEGLNDLSVSRKDVSWGTRVPFDDKHTIYVWIDALVNYISALGYPDGKLFKKYWPADIHLIGKGINWFHSVIWPALLIAAEIELPAKIFVHGYLTINGKKMSKSLGNIVDPMDIISNYGADALRHFLLRDVPFGGDGDFSHKTFIHRYNSDLANDLGNLLNRTLTMIEKYFDGSVPAADKEATSDKDLVDAACNLWQRLDASMGNLEINRSLEAIWELINKANKYIEDSKPWALAKGDTHRLKTVIYNLSEVLRLVTLSVSCFMPQTATLMWQQLGQTKPMSSTSIDDMKTWGKTASGLSISKGNPLFPRIKEE